MSTDERTANNPYKVVINDEEQRSILRLEQPCPAGWREEGARGSREDCLAHIDRTWTDLRPLSLRQRIEG